MAAVILSRPASNTDKVLRRSEYSRDRVGLETIVETYTVKTAARISIQPDKDVLHSVYTASGMKYPRMSVDQVSFRDLDGDLTEMSVTYVGLTSDSGLPPALVKMIPTSGAGVFGPPVVIQVEYLSDVSIVDLIQGKTASKLGAAGWGYLKIPPSINGTPLPPSPKAPYAKSGIGYSVRYEGYVADDVQAIPRGMFHLITINYRELFQAGGTVSSSGFSGGGNSADNAAAQGQVSWGRKSSS